MQSLIRIDWKKLTVNRVIQHFVICDLMLWGGWGFIGPIFAVYIIRDVASASVVTVGAASAIYWIAKSILQIPIALMIDRKEGERDDFRVLLTGLVLAGVAAFSFLLVHDILGLYLVCFLQAVAFSCYIPAWSAIFSRHLDKDRFAFEWSLDSTAVGIAAGFAAFIGGSVAEYFGFAGVFVLAGILSFAAAIVLFFVPSLILPKPTVPGASAIGAPRALDKNQP